ncbi:MFS transporter [Pseudonocardia sp. NPDC049635]|uniref:MFS transporter n=1 Tax=Pseudonocardia sp. NPDC049635 TaxID=3155506 RepID=UPI0033CF3222
MTWFQWRAILICVVLNMIDGFDVLVMAFTAQSVAAEWQLSGSTVGLLLSAGLFGLALGSLFVAPYADRFGRRPVVIVCLVIAGAGMVLSAVAQSALQLGLLRVLTGIGVGGILASTNVIAAEYASRRWRGMAVSLQATGYALGATLGGLLAVALIGSWGWRSVFMVGGVVTLLVLVLVVFALPESMDHLLTRRRPDALERVNRLVGRLGQPPVEALPEPARSTAVDSPGLATLLAAPRRRTTLVLWAAFFLVMSGFYFVTSWTPTLLVDAGLSASGGITGGVLLNVGGMFGAIAFGALTARLSIRTVVISYLGISSVMLALFIASAQALPLLVLVGVMIGMFLNGSIGGLYALTPTSYDAGVRATAMGAAIGVGRIGAILAPLAAGALLDGGATPQMLYIAVAGLVLLAGIVLFGLPRARPGLTGQVDEVAPAGLGDNDNR